MTYCSYEVNIKEENNGYVVFKENIHGSAGNKGGGEGRGNEPNNY
jgi:hypothetical protein